MRLKVGLIALAALTVTTGCSLNHGTMVASVNGQPIYLSDLQDSLHKETVIHSMGTGTNGEATWRKFAKLSVSSPTYERYARGTLEGMVDQILVDQKAAALHLSVSPSEVVSQLTTFQEGYIDKNAFEKAVQSSGVTTAELESEIKDELLFQKLENTVINRDQVTRAEVTAYFNKHKSDYILPKSIHIAQIYTTDRNGIKDAQAALARGMSWAQAVSMYSKDSNSIYQSGDIGNYSKGYLAPAVDKAVWAAKAGQVVGPIQVGSGWYLMKVLGFIAPHPDTLNDVYFSIYHSMSEARRAKVQSDFLTEIRKGAKIKYLVSWLKPTAADNKAAKAAVSAQSKAKGVKPTPVKVKSVSGQQTQAKG